jgi:hypothetical protein
VDNCNSYVLSVTGFRHRVPSSPSPGSVVTGFRHRFRSEVCNRSWRPQEDATWRFIEARRNIVCRMSAHLKVEASFKQQSDEGR